MACSLTAEGVAAAAAVTAAPVPARAFRAAAAEHALGTRHACYAATSTGLTLAACAAAAVAPVVRQELPMLTLGHQRFAV